MTEPREPLPAWQGWAITLTATATMATSYLDRQVLAALAPSVQEDLGIDDAAYGDLQSAFSFAYLAATPFAGRWLDRVGIRGGLLGAVLAWTMVSAGHALAPGFGALFALRLALGVTESPSFPGSAAAIACSLPPQARARGMGLLFTGSSIGAMIAPPLAIALAAHSGSWRLPFAGVALAGLLWVPLWLLVTSPRGVRAALAARAEDAPRASILQTVRHPAVRRAAALVLALSPMFAFVLLWSAKVLHDVLGLPQEEAGRVLWLPPLLFDLGAVSLGWLASRHARIHGAGRTPLLLVLAALGMALGIALVPWCRSSVAFVAVGGIAMAGGAGLFAILTADMVSRVGPAVAASAAGITAASQSLAYVVANPLIGRGVAQPGGYAVVTTAIALWMLPGALYWIATRDAPLEAPR